MKKGVIQWFIRLIKRDMSNFTAESKEEKQKMYEDVKKKLKN